MAYYITADGRVHEIEVDVKQDGTVRPLRYTELSSDKPAQKNNDNIDEKYNRLIEERKRNKAKALIKNKITKAHKEKDQELSQSYAAKELAKAKASLEKARAKASLEKARIKAREIELDKVRERALNRARDKVAKSGFSFDPRFYATKNDGHNKKRINAEIRQKIDIILRNSKLSKLAIDFIIERTNSLAKVGITKKLYKRIKDLGLAEEYMDIITAISKINYAISEKKHSYQNQTVVKPYTPKPAPVKSPSKRPKANSQNNQKKVKYTVESANEYNSPDKINRTLKSNERLSGNYIRKGPVPKYGYARDRFGRVQERDSYREDRDVNPYNTNSSYDREDDNSSMDILD